MSFEIQIKGLDEALEYLDGLTKKVSSDSFWASVLGKFIRAAQRFAVSISPVVTGAYAGSHRVVVGTKIAMLSPMVRYATSVEERHHVYDRTATYTYRLVVRDAEVLGEEVLR